MKPEILTLINHFEALYEEWYESSDRSNLDPFTEKQEFQSFRRQIGEISITLGQKPSEDISNLITIEDLVRRFEQENSHQEATGAIYTPLEIAQLIINKTLNGWCYEQLCKAKKELQNEIIPTSIDDFFYQELLKSNESDLCQILFEKVIPELVFIDPCVGGGAFLLAFAKNLLNQFSLLFLHYQSQQKVEDLVKYAKLPITEKLQHIPDNIRKIWFNFILRILQNQVYIYDINNIALRITRLRLVNELFTQYPSRDWGNPHLINFNAIQGDFLLLSPTSQKKAAQIIVGNPPYISSDTMGKHFSQNIIKTLKLKYTRVIKSGSKPDYFFYFIEQALQWLAPGGWLGYIIPNRILANDYADKLRNRVLTDTSLRYVIDFFPELMIFSEANVHPCIIISQNSPPQMDHRYSANYITHSVDLSNYDLGGGTRISQTMTNQFSILPIALPQATVNMLEKLGKIGSLGDVVHIREATRLARFEHRLHTGWPIRVDSTEYSQLLPEMQQYYVREIRGKEIQQDLLLKGTTYLQLPPEFIRPEFKSRSSIALDLVSPKIFLRELGDRIYCCVDLGNHGATLGYGGVYYFSARDLNSSYFKKQTKTELMWGIYSYLTSDIVSHLYRLLFNAGAWGSALKFRSAYLHRLPWTVNDYLLLARIGQTIARITSNIPTNERFVHQGTHNYEKLYCRIRFFLDLLIVEGWLCAISPRDSSNLGKIIESSPFFLSLDNFRQSPNNPPTDMEINDIFNQIQIVDSNSAFQDCIRKIFRSEIGRILFNENQQKK